MSDASITTRAPTVLELIGGFALDSGRNHPTWDSAAAQAETEVVLRARREVAALVSSDARYRGQDAALRAAKARQEAARGEAKARAEKERVAADTQRDRVEQVRREVRPAPSTSLVAGLSVLHAAAQAVVMTPTVLVAFFPPDPLTGTLPANAQAYAFGAGFGIGLVISAVSVGTAWYADRSRFLRWLPTGLGLALATGVAALRHATLPPGPAALGFAVGLFLVELVLCLVLEGLAHVVRSRLGQRQNLEAEELILSQREGRVAGCLADAEAADRAADALDAQIAENLEQLALAEALQDPVKRAAFVEQAEATARDAFRSGQAQAA